LNRQIEYWESALPTKREMIEQTKSWGSISGVSALFLWTGLLPLWRKRNSKYELSLILKKWSHIFISKLSTVSHLFCAEALKEENTQDCYLHHPKLTTIDLGMFFFPVFFPWVCVLYAKSKA
jgi:hypothetical protein